MGGIVTIFVISRGFPPASMGIWGVKSPYTSPISLFLTVRTNTPPPELVDISKKCEGLIVCRLLLLCDKVQWKPLYIDEHMEAPPIAGSLFEMAVARCHSATWVSESV